MQSIDHEHYLWHSYLLLDYEALVPNEWLEKMKLLEFPYNAEQRYHEEYEGFHTDLEAGTSNLF